MRWMFFVVAVAVGVLSALLGLTLGINLNPQSTLKFVPAWGSLGDWFSGMGAFAAVGVSLWISMRGERLQAAKENDNIRIEQRIAGVYAHLHVISEGHYPITIKRVLIGSVDRGSLALDLLDPNGAAIEMPLRLGFREEIHASWRIDQHPNLLTPISWLRPFTLNELNIEVVTVLGVHVVPIDPNFVAWLQDAAQKHGVKLLRP